MCLFNDVNGNYLNMMIDGLLSSPIHELVEPRPVLRHHELAYLRQKRVLQTKHSFIICVKK